MLHRISSQLGLGPDRISHFEQGLSLPRRRAASVEAFTQLNLDTYTVISDWYHYAILELVRLKNFQPNPAWIAKTLSITVSEVNFAIERLQRLGMLEISKHGWQQKAGQLTTIGSKLTATALRKLQQQILAQATDALNSVPMQQRDQSAMTMSIDSSKIAEAKLRIQKFRRELCEFLEAGDNCDEVYQLSISLFPISNTGTRK